MLHDVADVVELELQLIEGQPVEARPGTPCGQFEHTTERIKAQIQKSNIMTLSTHHTVIHPTFIPLFIASGVLSVSKSFSNT